MTNDKNQSGKYDLEERTTVFAEAIVDFAKRIPATPVNNPLISQLVRAGTSVGANYAEADDAGSKKDFQYKIGICKREARESRYWLRLVARSEPNLKEDVKKLWQEAKELHLIFATIHRRSKEV